MNKLWHRKGWNVNVTILLVSTHTFLFLLCICVVLHWRICIDSQWICPQLRNSHVLAGTCTCPLVRSTVPTIRFLPAVEFLETVTFISRMYPVIDRRLTLHCRAPWEELAPFYLLSRSYAALFVFWWKNPNLLVPFGASPLIHNPFELWALYCNRQHRLINWIWFIIVVSWRQYFDR